MCRRLEADRYRQFSSCHTASLYRNMTIAVDWTLTSQTQTIYMHLHSLSIIFGHLIPTVTGLAYKINEKYCDFFLINNQYRRTLFIVLKLKEIVSAAYARKLSTRRCNLSLEFPLPER